MIMVGAEICQGKHEMITIEISFSTTQVCHIFFRVLNKGRWYRPETC